MPSVNLQTNVAAQNVTRASQPVFNANNTMIARDAVEYALQHGDISTAVAMSHNVMQGLMTLPGGTRLAQKLKRSALRNEPTVLRDTTARLQTVLAKSTCLGPTISAQEASIASRAASLLAAKRHLDNFSAARPTGDVYAMVAHLNSAWDSAGLGALTRYLNVDGAEQEIKQQIQQKMALIDGPQRQASEVPSLDDGGSADTPDALPGDLLEEFAAFDSPHVGFADGLSDFAFSPSMRSVAALLQSPKMPLFDEYFHPEAARSFTLEEPATITAPQDALHGSWRAQTPPLKLRVYDMPETPPGRSPDATISQPVSPKPVARRKPSGVIKRGRKQDATNAADRIFACVGHCDFTFRRKEHLKRHIKSYSQEKPFACRFEYVGPQKLPSAKCVKRFSRHDNRVQHEDTHRSAYWVYVG